MASHRKLVINLVATVLGMFMLAYASVPLYRLFCEATGYGGTPKTAKVAPAHALSQTMTVTFNADVDMNLPWEFKPGQKKLTVRIGEQTLAYYTAENTTSHAITGRAVYNVVPMAAAAYFTKIECFCFKEQTLPAHAKVNMPVSFFIDPAIVDDPELKNIKTITLSYTFFESKK